MNKTTARKVLGLTGTEDIKTIKSKYRKLMHEIHPDSGFDTADVDYAARINEAYNVLKDDSFPKKKEHKSSKAPKAHNNWNAKINKSAYCARPIYHQIEDYDGNSIGTIEIAKDKYIWTLEEDFNLFLKSVYETGKELLINSRLGKDEPSEVTKQKYISNLVYLLSSQYIDSSATLKELATLEDGIYKINAMVEINHASTIPRAGTSLFPAGISNHRLYVRQQTGDVIGYLSFNDDRLYYVLIPLLERKNASVKMTVIPRRLKSNARNKYADIELWMKIKDTKSDSIESTNIQIEELLTKYSKEG